MTRLLGLTVREALQKHPGKKLIFQVTGGYEKEIAQEEMRIIRVINYDDKIECTIADPDRPQGKTPS